MKRKLTFWPVVLCVVLFSLSVSRRVYGQAETGAIDGTVTDSTGAVIPSGKVVVRSVATGAERTASTNDRGYYNFSNLLPGLYWVVAEAPNLAKSERRVEVTVGSRNEVNLQLALGTTSTVVEVVGEGGAAGQHGDGDAQHRHRQPANSAIADGKSGSLCLCALRWQRF